MQKILKYPLEVKDKQLVEILNFERILKVGLDTKQDLCLWALTIHVDAPVQAYRGFQAYQYSW